MALHGVCFGAFVRRLLVTIVALMVAVEQTHAVPVGDRADGIHPAHGQWPQTVYQRIQSPCAGEQPVGRHLQHQNEDVSSSSSSNNNDGGESNGIWNQKKTLREANRMLERLQRNVNSLKQDYAVRRHATSIGIHADGMPLSTQVNVVVNLRDAVSDTIRQLSHVAVLLDLVTVEEVLHETDPLTDPLKRLHDDPEHGIFNILCRLHSFWPLVTNGHQRSSSVNQLVNETARLRLTHTTQSHRHLRNYSILHDLEDLLSRLIARFETFIAAAAVADVS